MPPPAAQGSRRRPIAGTSRLATAMSTADRVAPARVSVGGDDMTLLERVTTEIAAAMKAKDQARRAPLRMLKTALTNRQVEKGRELEDTEDRQVVASLVKQRHDSIDQFRRGGGGAPAAPGEGG